MERTTAPAGTTCPRHRGGRQHTLAHAGAWPWLPTDGRRHLAPHPWCTHCGQVKSVGTERAKKLGGLVNLLANLERVLEAEGRVVTQAQMRLAIRAIQAREADDAFALNREAQLKLVSDVVAQCFGLTPEVALTYVRSC